MNPIPYLLQWIDRVFDPLCPLIGWHVRRAVQVVIGFLPIYLLIVLVVPLVPLWGDIFASNGTGLFVVLNVLLSFSCVIGPAVSADIQVPAKHKQDEMLKLNGLTPAERCYGNVVPVLVVAGLAAAVVLPCCLYLSLFGLSLTYLILSLLPLVVGCNLALMWPALIELRPKRGKYRGRWIRWMIHVFLWDSVQVSSFLFFVSGVIALFLAAPEVFPVGHYERFGPYFMLVLLVFGVLQFQFLRFQIARNLDSPRRAMIAHCVFYAVALPVYFPAAWLPVYVLSA